MRRDVTALGRSTWKQRASGSSGRRCRPFGTCRRNVDLRRTITVRDGAQAPSSLSVACGFMQEAVRGPGQARVERRPAPAHSRVRAGSQQESAQRPSRPWIKWQVWMCGKPLAAAVDVTHAAEGPARMSLRGRAKPDELAHRQTTVSSRDERLLGLDRRHLGDVRPRTPCNFATARGGAHHACRIQPAEDCNEHEPERRGDARDHTGS